MMTARILWEEGETDVPELCILELGHYGMCVCVRVRVGVRMR